MRWLPALLVAVPFLALVPTGQAHGLVNAGELEILVTEDEASDVVTGLEAGYDLVQLYVGEAYVPSVGDGLYVHTILYGGAGDGRPGLDGPQEVRFDFDFGDRVVTRQVATTDGQTFTTDFDHLDLVVGDGEVEIQRGFLLYPDGISPDVGSTLQQLRATTLVNGQPRDVAPGGTFLPGLPAEVPNFESYPSTNYHLDGPGMYVDTVELDAVVEGDQLVFIVTAPTALEKGSQHIVLVAPEHESWRVQVDGTGGDTPPGGYQTFRLRFTPGEGDYAFQVLTDIGGRETLRMSHTANGYWLESEDGALSVPSGPAQDVPASPAWALLALVLLAAVATRKPQP